MAAGLLLQPRGAIALLALGAAPSLAALFIIESEPQILAAALCGLFVVLQGLAPDSGAARAYRTFILVLTTWVGAAIVAFVLASLATPQLPHPTMPLGEMLVALTLASTAALVVLCLRLRRIPDYLRVDDDLYATTRTRAEPRLGLAMQAFAMLVLVIVILPIW